MTEAEVARIKARSKDLRRRIETTLDKHGVQDPDLVNALGLTMTEGCLGDWVVKVGGVHTARVFRFKITDVLEHNDTLALDSARDRRVLVEALVEALR